MEINLHIKRRVLIEKFNIEIEKNIFFLSFLDGCKIQIDKRYPGFLFYYKEGIILFQQNLKNKYFNIRYDSIWSIFEKKYQMEYQQTQAFIKYILETHLKLERYTPNELQSTYFQQLETHLKLEGYTPSTLFSTTTNMLETHLKLEDFTPYKQLQSVSIDYDRYFKIDDFEFNSCGSNFLKLYWEI